ncbi:LacI family DNA-binding transcriptional regulator [Brevibacillus formosus]|uniref:LacI family DNA-binding transcriptional regulator n=1 Tax=Brevibacillus formosus TaxID=54913 RepID=UPI003F1BC9C1
MNIKTVAEYAGVSIATVSNVVHGKKIVKASTREKVLKAIHDLNYTPNAIAQSLKARKTNTIGVVISDISNPFFSTIIRGIEDASKESGYNVILCNTDEDYIKENEYLEVLKRKQIDGIILSATGRNENLKKLKKLQIPVVYIDRIPEEIDGPLVTSDNEKISYEATQHLIAQGFRKIGIIIGSKIISTTKERLNGYIKCLQEHGIPIHEEYIAVGDSRITGGKKAMEALYKLEDRPEAVFVTNSLMTLGALDYLKSENIRYSNDVSIIGYQDQDWEADWTLITNPAITVVKQPTYQIGWKAAHQLLKHITEGEELQSKRYELPCKLIIRESTQNPRAKKESM